MGQWFRVLKFGAWRFRFRWLGVLRDSEVSMHKAWLHCTSKYHHGCCKYSNCYHDGREQNILRNPRYPEPGNCGLLAKLL